MLVLGVEGVGMDHDFFDMGGHSLLVMKLIAQLRSTVDVDVTVQDIFDNHVYREYGKITVETISWGAAELRSFAAIFGRVSANGCSVLACPLRALRK